MRKLTPRVGLLRNAFYVNKSDYVAYNGKYETDDLTRKPGILLFPGDLRRQAVKRDSPARSGMINLKQNCDR